MNRTSKLVAIFVLALGVFTSTVPNAEAATLRSSAMASANSQAGAKYVWGAEGGYSKGYDCSGLIYWSYKQHGKTLYRTAQGQYNHSQHISVSNKKPGDLVFFISDGRVFHVGIYTGMRNGHEMMTDANSGAYRGYKVVTNAPVYEFTKGEPHREFGRY